MNLTELGRQWGQNSARTASATANYWWIKYEEFVGLKEVREAQMKVTEAEKAFMGRLKEVRDRLDRVSREEAHYLELATLEHKLLQEERRLRTAYENAEGAERERFSLFSAAGGVRESHDKERTRGRAHKKLVPHRLYNGSPDWRHGLHLHQQSPPPGTEEPATGGPEGASEPAGKP
ncbi:hypothetical protein SKAU_G00156000 [Synaphobranchus kaupii]|uniref:Uncharacterized protein n=1 Tax=Synaphobranchus kaupii TaxID=118154 RepID=A0A9Q1FI49_SYNKA|nr:hypothetical protein SKAU_G00156000 [Synaphobranchus kaupii]